MKNERQENEKLWSATLDALDGKVRTSDTIKHDLSQTLPSLQATNSTKELPAVELSASNTDLQVKTLLGSGGMGQVHLAWQRSLARDVAVKTAKNPTSTAIVSLMQEGRVMGQLEHPNIIPVHALGVDNGNPVLVMKRIDGVTWSTLLEDPKHEAWSKLDASDDRQAFHLQVLLQLCNAVQFAHSRGVIHRDIKPSNVMLGPFGEVYLLDWGLATKLENGQAASESLVGTPNYMAPEMISLEPVTVATDIFLLGGVLHLILCGAPPNPGETIQAAFLSATEPRERSFPESTPEELASICRRALALSPSERFESAAELRAALRAYLQHRSSIAIERATRPKLRELQQAIEAGDLIAARSAFAESQFGLKLALHDWSENLEAKEKLRQALLQMARFELSQEQLEHAETLLREIVTPPAELLQQLGALRGLIAQKTTRQRELEDVASKLDLSIGSKSRTLLLVGLSGVLFVLSLMLSIQELTGSPFTHPMMLTVSMTPLLFCVIGAALYRQKINDPLTKKMLYLVLFSLLCVNIHRAIVLWLAGDIAAALSVDMLFLSGILGCAAITTYPKMLPLSLLQLAGYLFAVFAPKLSLHVFNLVQPLTILLLAVLDRALSKKTKILV